MEIYKGIATFSGIAIGKILYYSRGEYQIRQCLVSNIKKEIEDFRKAKEQAVAKLKELYEANKSLNEQEARTFLNQAKLLESGSFQNAIESSIANEKVNAAYAVMTNRDELVETFRNLEEPVIRKRISDIQEILTVPIIGAVTDEEEIVISSNNGEPVAGKDSPLGQIFVDICRRIMGEDIPVAQPSVSKGLIKRLKSILEKKGK